MATSVITTSIDSHAITLHGVVEYVITVRVSDKDAARVRRRFREFNRLDNDLGSTVGALPSRLFDTSADSRMLRLDAFLKAVCEQWAPAGCTKAAVPRPLLAFLGLENTSFGETAPLIVRYGTPQVPAAYANDIERVVRQVKEAAASKDGEGGWRQLGSKGTVSWSLRAASPGVKANRLVRGTLTRAPPRLVLELFMDVGAAKALEPGIKHCFQVAKLGEHTSVQYYLMHSIMMTAERDVLMVRHWRVEPDTGHVVVAEFSLDEHAGAPAGNQGGRVRAVLTCGGCVIEPDASDPLGCRVTVVNDMDPMLGDIPPWAMDKLNEITASMLSNNIVNLVAVLQTRSKEFGAYLAKGPAVNANGSVEGGGAPRVYGDDAREPRRWTPKVAAAAMLAAAGAAGVAAVAFGVIYGP